MPLQLEINNEFKQAFDLIADSRQNLFITGKAGTGKSTLLDYCWNNCSKNMVILAPTGVAALNVKGQTIHRFFGFPVNISVEKIERKDFSPRSRKIFQNLETIIIDEASMLRADLLDCINALLKLYGPERGKPFGGIQIVLVGDLYQLPPVISNQEKGFFAAKYSTPYFFSAESLKEISLDVIELKKIYRQKDQEFIELLNRIRSNSITSDDLQKLNSRVGIEYDKNDIQKFRVSLTTTNAQADEVNQSELANLPESLYSSTAVIDGDFKPEFYPTADVLNFKIGSQIMFLNNDAKNRWVNGSVGHIENVKLRDGQVRYLEVRLQSNQRLVAVFPYTWEIFKYTVEGSNIISEAVGSFTQYPFRLAWSVTIHKSQGKTFDNVEIDIGNGTFASGQLYVALSRCTSFEGIILKKPILQRHILTDYRINEFMSNYCQDIEISAYNKLQLLTESIRKRQPLEIIYLKADNTLSKRVIIPQRLSDTSLLALCTQRNAQRSFTIERITKIKILDNPPLIQKPGLPV